MHWLLYDISNNHKRDRMARLCKDYGLIRMQRSCFFGEIDREKMEKLHAEIEVLLERDDSAFLIPVTKATAQQTKVWGTSNYLEMRAESYICFI